MSELHFFTVQAPLHFVGGLAGGQQEQWEEIITPIRVTEDNDGGKQGEKRSGWRTNAESEWCLGREITRVRDG